MSSDIKFNVVLPQKSPTSSEDPNPDHQELEEIKVPVEYAQKTDTRSRALVVEGRELWVCPELLADRSRYFERIFSGSFMEKEQEKIPLPNMDFRSFLRFFNCIYGELLAYPLRRKISTCCKTQ